MLFAAFRKAHVVGVLNISGSVCPLQVVRMIIGLISVKVVWLRILAAPHRNTDEQSGNEDMHSNPPSGTWPSKHKVPVTARLAGTKNLRLSALPFAIWRNKRPYPAVTGNFIISFEPWNGPPDLALKQSRLSHLFFGNALCSGSDSQTLAIVSASAWSFIPRLAARALMRSWSDFDILTTVVRSTCLLMPEQNTELQFTGNTYFHLISLPPARILSESGCMFLRNYTSTVPVAVTIGRIESILIQCGVRGITKEYGPQGETVALTFHIDQGESKIAVRLPANPRTRRG